MTVADLALQRALAAHTDPRRGSPYWIERRESVRGVSKVAALVSLGPFDRSVLETRPLRDFVPRSILETRATGLVVAETGGSSGPPVRRAFTPEEFHEAFGEPFVRAARARGFPRGGRWLFIGPSGPHVIGQAARLLARLQGAPEPFCVDFDPRWARAQDGLAARLYQEHVLAQVLDVIRREEPDVLFATPPILTRLAAEFDAAQRERIRGIHLGGLPVTTEDLLSFRSAFPGAVILPGYGNSLVGMLPELRPADGGAVEYFPLAGRLVVEVVREDSATGQVSIDRPVAAGEQGRVLVHCLDQSFFLPNFVERDCATAVERPVVEGFAQRGLRSPEPVEKWVPSTSGGLY